MKFFNYIPRCDGRPGSVLDFYEWMGRQIEGDQAEQYGEFLRSEYRWVTSGRGYCKVFPAMAEMLRLTDIDIPIDFFKPPQVPFAVRFAEPIQCNEKLIGSAIVDPVIIDGSVDHLLISGQDYRLLPLSPRMPGHVDQFSCPIPLKLAETIEANLQQLVLVGFEPFMPVISIAISACCFISGQHKLVAPDIEPRVLPSREIERQKRQHGGKGPAMKLKLGHEIELPPPIQEYLNRQRGAATGRELAFGHLRRGHVRQQAIGPRDAEPRQHKPIWVEPTIVRPDLEIRASNYRIPDPVHA